VICDISVLHKLQVIVGDLSRKFGVAKSVCHMKHLVGGLFLCYIISFFSILLLVNFM